MPDGVRSEMPIGQAEFEAMLRRYMAKIGARYAPVVLAALLVLLIIILVPTTQPGSQQNALGSRSGTASNNGSGLAGSQDAGNAPALAGPAGAVNSALASVGGAAQSAGLGAGGAAPADFLGTGSTSGIARTGVHCGQGVRQFAWTGHSPSCEAAFTGNNGGATAQGVTANTVTLTFRIPSSTQDQLIAAAAGAANVNYPAMLADMQTYINYFNNQFELYGRRVSLKAYHGQGDYISEDQGQNLGAAQADAVSAKTMGAFGDVTFTLGSSQAYEQDLADEHVMSFSSIEQPQSFYEQYAPYEWSVQLANGTNSTKASAELVCRRLAGLPAIYSGDSLSQHTTRKFGIIFPEIPNYAQDANLYKQLLQQTCNQSIAETVGYAINVSQFPGQATTIMAQMNSAHVTTILCACDPIFPVFLTRAAVGQAYHPEWVSIGAGDPSGRLYDQSEWGHEFGAGMQFPDPRTTEAFHVYQLANPGHVPAEGSANGGPPYFYVPYYTVLHVFEGLQAAGPNLNAATFQQGMFSLPPTIGPDAIGGQWVFGPGVYDPVNSFTLVWWNPNGKSAFDGNAGTYVSCNNNQIYSLDHLEALGGPHQQLNCFGH